MTAAAGAVGTAAIQLVRTLNGVPVAAVGSPEKKELPLSLGAQEAVTYEELGELEQVDVVFDLVGGDVFAASLSLLKPLGTAIAAGYAGGLWQRREPDAGSSAGTSASTASTSAGSSAADPELVERAAQDVLRLWEGGVVRPVVGAELPLEEAGEAHRLIEERKTTGKVVLVP